jgi:hypothetical protein
MSVPPLVDIVYKGQLYHPALTSPLPKNAAPVDCIESIICVKCHRDRLCVSIRYQYRHLCLPCADTLGPELLARIIASLPSAYDPALGTSPVTSVSTSNRIRTSGDVHNVNQGNVYITTDAPRVEEPDDDPTYWAARADRHQANGFLLKLVQQGPRGIKLTPPRAPVPEPKRKRDTEHEIKLDLTGETKK